MVRILHSVSNLDRGGIESMLMNYYRNIDREQFQFDFLVHKNNIGFFEQEVRDLGGHIYVAPSFSPLKIDEYKLFMKNLLAQDKPDDARISILHAHNEAMELYPLLAAKDVAFPVRIAHAHNTHLPLNVKLPVKMVCKQFIPNAATDYWACGREAGKYYFHEDWDKRGVIMHNAVDLSQFSFDPEARKRIRMLYGLGDKLVIGCVGRFMRQKNHTRLLDIFAAIHVMYPDSVLMLVGDGELRETLEVKVADLDLQNSVLFTGVQAKTAPFYSAMDIHVMPSLFEGLPVTGIEAQVSGVPCFFADSITDEVCLPGYSSLVALKQPDKIWAEAILAARVGEKNRAARSKTASALAVEAGYDIVHEAKVLEQRYTELAIRKLSN